MSEGLESALNRRGPSRDNLKTMPFLWRGELPSDIKWIPLWNTDNVLAGDVEEVLAQYAYTNGSQS